MHHAHSQFHLFKKNFMDIGSLILLVMLGISRISLKNSLKNYLKRFKSALIGGHQIDYCLWSHPNGSTISNNSNKYAMNITTPFSCDLTIHSKYKHFLQLNFMHIKKLNYIL